MPSARGLGCSAPLASDDERVKVGNTFQFGQRFRQGFSTFAAAGNNNVAIFKGAL
jgi:hypothetical protein